MSVTIKLHILIFHVKEMLDTYGTVGLFAEDSLESIHAVVNQLSRQYASLDRKRKVKQVYRNLAARSKCSERQQSDKKKAGKETKKRSIRQGAKSGVIDREAGRRLDEKFKDAIDVFFSACVQHQAEDTDDTSATNEEPDESHVILPEIELCYCEDCSEKLDSDVQVPKILLDLHKILVHSEAHDKAGIKKMKTE